MLDIIMQGLTVLAVVLGVLALSAGVLGGIDA